MPIKEIRDIIFSIFKSSSLKVISRQKILLGIALLLGLSLLLYQSLLAVQLITSKAKSFCLSSQKKLAVYQQKIVQDPQALLGKIQEKWNELKSLEKKFTPEREIEYLFNDLKGLVGRAESRLVSLDIKPLITIAENYQKLPFSILVKGHYVDIILLLNKFEAYPRLINIKEIKIRPTGESSAEVTMSLEAESFVVKD